MEKNMRKLAVFENVTLDGCFSGVGGDLSWAHTNDGDPEWNAFVSENASGGGVLLLGRITYDMMVSWWPTPQAMETMPVVAERMNDLPKVVFSRTMERAMWNNTRLVRDDIAAAVRSMKKESGPDMVILGSGRIVSQLAREGLIDAYQIVVNPIVLGGGRTMFEGIRDPLKLRLTGTRGFRNGNVLLDYENVG
jgi:dihydrofolate reductase